MSMPFPMGPLDERPRRLRPLFVLLGALIAGILIAPALPLPPLFFYIATPLLLFAALIFPLRQPLVVTALLALPFLAGGIGLARQAALPQHNDVTRLAVGSPSLWVEGTVDSPAQRSPLGSLHFTLEAQWLDDYQTMRATSGRLLVVLTKPEGVAPLHGDRVWIRGRVEEIEGQRNPGGFDANAYYARRGIHGRLIVHRANDIRPALAGRSAPRNPALWAERLRDNVLRTIAAHLSGEDAALLSALLLSDRSRIPADTEDAFARTGALHVLAVSGLHLAALAGVLAWALPFAGLPRRAGNGIIVALLWTLALSAGGGIAAARAAIVLTVVLCAPLLRRTADTLHSLAFAAIVLLVAAPLSLYDPGFQLSFATIAVILLFLPPLERLLLSWEPGQTRRAAAARYLLVALLGGCVAQVGAAPLIAYYFNAFSFVAPVVGVLVAPVAVGLLLGGWGAVAATSVLPNIVVAPLWVGVALGLHLLRGLVFACSALPFAAVSVASPPTVVLVLYYGLLATAAPLLRRTILERRKPRFS